MDLCCFATDPSFPQVLPHTLCVRMCPLPAHPQPLAFPWKNIIWSTCIFLAGLQQRNHMKMTELPKRMMTSLLKQHTNSPRRQRDTGGRADKKRILPLGSPPLLGVAENGFTCPSELTSLSITDNFKSPPVVHGRTLSF